MNGIAAVARRELKSYFATPVAYVFIVVFLVAAGVFTFYFGGFYERGQADLNPFFRFHPWLFLFFVPALSMRLWAEERRSGSIELLMTLPIEAHEAVVGKFLAAWAFTAFSIALTFPIWITVNYLGSPDNGAIAAAYVGSLLMAGGFLAVGSFVSAVTKSQVVAFVLSVTVCFLLLLAGYPLVLDVVSGWAPQALVDGIAGLSFLTHFESISRGVLDLRDIVYFVGLTGAALYANVVVLAVAGGGSSRNAGALATLALLAVALIAAVIASDRLLSGLRLDLTENGLYTLSPGTRNLLEGGDEPINLYFFFSDEQAADVRFLQSYARRVREMLEELVAASPGRLTLHEIDPPPFSAEEDRAARFGLRDLGAAGEDSVYFGLAATNSVGEEAVIDVFEPSKAASLEYDLARLIYSLSTSDKTVVGLLSQAPMSGGFDPQTQQPTRPWAVLGQMRQLFDVRTLEPSTASIDPEIDVLWIVHPSSLDDATLYAIDQFVLGGGRAVVFVDPHAEIVAATSGVPGADAPSSSLEPLLSTWGVRFDTSRFVADEGYALRITSGSGPRPVRHAGLLGVDGEGLGRTDVVTGDLDSVNLGTAGSLALAGDSRATLEPLLTSSAEAALLDTARLDTLADPAALLDGLEPTAERYVLAARLSGPVATAFPDGPPSDVLDAPASPSADGAPGIAPAGGAGHVAATDTARVIIVADVDVLGDRLWVRRQQSLLGRKLTTAFASNGDFVGNALANLGGSEDLIGLESRATFARPFERVEALRREADARLSETEQRLEQRLDETEQRLAELEQARGDSGSLLMTPEQQAELERFQAEQVRIRRELRAVRRDLDRSIERLGTVLKIVNIGAVPAAVIVVALTAAALRRRRRRPAS